MKKRVYRAGDQVQIVNPNFVRRVGYNLVWTELIKEVEEDPRTLKAWNILTDQNFDHEIAPSYSTNLFVVLQKVDFPLEFIKSIAMRRVEERNFGGPNRSLHYNFDKSCQDKVALVNSKRVVKTGTRYSGSYTGWEYQEYYPGGLDNMKTHILLNTSYGEVEIENVKFVK